MLTATHPGAKSIHNRRPIYKQYIHICKKCRGYGCSDCNQTGSIIKERIHKRYAKAI